MKRFATLVLTVIVLVGCHTPTATPSSLPEKIITNQGERLQVIGALSTGVDVSLDKKDIPAATQLNDKIQSLAETPTPAQVKVVTDSLDNADAAKRLNDEITRLIEEKRSNEQQTRLLVSSLATKLIKAKDAEKTAKERLDELSNPFTAITYGIKTLIKRFLWTITGCGIVFLLLRTFAASNPIVGAIFDVVQRIVGWLITAVATLFPKAVSFGSSVLQRKDETLTVLVDAIEALPATATMAELKRVLAEDMDTAHKSEVAEIQKRLGW